MKENREHIDKLILAQLVGALDDDASKELEKWIDISSENENYFLQRKEAYFTAISEKGRALYNKDKAFRLFKSRVSEVTYKPDIVRQKHLRLFSFWHYAAVVAILCIVSYFAYWRGEQRVKEYFAEIVVEAPLGSRTKLYLPDGTLVWLNNGSRITYSQGFGVEERQVKMVGEGYFEVKRNEDLPFLVQTEDLRVKVLGTKFNFRDYPDDNEVIVSLLEGKVSLNNLIRKEKELCLFPNDRMVLDKKKGKMQLERAVATNATQWTKGFLYFDEELLPDIVKELERGYNVKINIANDELNTFRFYGNFVQREQSINEVLDALATTGKVRYKIDGSEITLY